jgi:hypothetical protein
MFTRVSALCLVAGAIGGYAVAGSSVTAQNAAPRLAPPFVNQGDELMLIVLPDKTEHGACTIADIQGSWIRCATNDRFASRPVQEWWNLQDALRLQKREK